MQKEEEKQVNNRLTDRSILNLSGVSSSNSVQLKPSGGGGLYSANPVEVKEKQQQSQILLQQIMKYLNREELPKLLAVFKEFKTCDRIEPLFKRLRAVFFGNLAAPSKANDR